MRIVHVAPVWLPVSVASHGGIETFLAELVAAQVEDGHDVTLVAAAGSTTRADLVPAVEEALVPAMRKNQADDYGYYEQALLAAALCAGERADVVHNHVIPGGFVLDEALRSGPPVLHTLHGQVTRDLVWSLRTRPRAVVGVSEYQARAAERGGALLHGVVHNGIDMRSVEIGSGPRLGLLFLGRVEPEKGPDIAIRVASECGLPLTLAGPVTNADYFSSAIEPQLTDTTTYVGVLDREQKYAALSRSLCLLVPSRWHEPFGMVSIEAMAAGTPVVGLARGALPEVIDDGVTGVVVEHEEELPEAVKVVAALDGASVRAAAWARFHIATTADAYVAQYRSLLGGAP